MNINLQLPQNNDEPFITRQLLEKWSSETWKTQWANSRNRGTLEGVADVEKLESYISSLRVQGDYHVFSNQSITGQISEGWRDLNVSGPLFQEALWSVMQTWPKDWTPVEYLMKYAIDCKITAPGHKNYDLGRAVRNLPSFLREYFIHSALFERGVDAVVPSPKENAQGHADLYITTENGKVGLWSFQSTNKGFGMLKQKIRFRASNFSDINFLCPFDGETDSVDCFDWYLPSNEYVDSIIVSLKNDKLGNVDELRSWINDGRRSSRFMKISGQEILKFKEG